MKKLFFPVFLFLTSLVTLVYSQNTHYRHFYNISDSLPVIQIEPSKKEYLVSEPIWIETEINIDSNLKLAYRPHINTMGEIYYDMRDTNGKEVYFHHYEADYTAPLPVSHLSYYFYVENMLSYHGETEDFESSQLMQKFKIKAGKYKITALFPLYTSKREYFQSEPVEIIIKEPEGEEHEARKEMLKIYTAEMVTSISVDEKYKQLESQVNNFLNKFPQSVYRDKVQSILNFYNHAIAKGTDDEIRQFLSDYYYSLINKYPDSYCNYGYVPLADIYGNDTERIKQLANEHDIPLLKKIINDWINVKTLQLSK